MAEIDILLAAYNGEKFIAEQLDSILNQTFQDFRIIIRDDGSSDRTPEIIAEYEKKYPEKIKVIHDDVICKNFVKNFFELMKHAEADYIMFSDQDDYWLKYKLQITLDYMKENERKNPNKPVLIFTGLEVVDEKLESMDRFLDYDLRKSRYSFENLVIQGCCVAGCTMMMNREIYENSCGYQDTIFAHDWWFALYASACGVLYHIPMALILYRQHSHNQFGADKYNDVRGGGHSRRFWNDVILFALRAIRIRKSVKNRFYKLRGQCELLRSRYSDKIHPDKLKWLDDYLGLYDKSGIKRLAAIRKMHYFSGLSLSRRIFFIIKYLIF